jgi:hypothetical protein
MSGSLSLEDLAVKRLGRYQLQLRSFLCLPSAVAFVWCIAGVVVDLKASLIETRQRWRDIRAAVAFHDKKAIEYQASAEAEIPDQVPESQLGDDGVWRLVTRPLSEFEIEERKLLRENAASRVVYHLAMKRKYESASWTPWRLVPRDPPPPSILWRGYSPILNHQN